MSLELPPLPYEHDALEPHISRETLNFHYDKHHQGYVNKVNTLIEGTRFANASLETIVRESDGGLFNNAAQVWNHTFYWHSMSPSGGGNPDDPLSRRLAQEFGSLEAFRKAFTEAAAGHFGSGWAWLVQRSDGSLAITATANADTPLRTPDTPLLTNTPLLTCDVWEHAYYIDRRNDRAAYLDAWWNVVNWDFAARNGNFA